MPRGDKSAYTEKQKRQAEHIEESERDRGASEGTAERIAWATVNKQDGGGKRAGSRKGREEGDQQEGCQEGACEEGGGEEGTGSQDRDKEGHKEDGEEGCGQEGGYGRGAPPQRRRPKRGPRRRPCARRRRRKLRVCARLKRRSGGERPHPCGNFGCGCVSTACSSRWGPSSDTCRASGNKSCSSATLGGHNRWSCRACRHNVGSVSFGNCARTSICSVAAARCRSIAAGAAAIACRSSRRFMRVRQCPSRSRASNASGGRGHAGQASVRSPLAAAPVAARRSYSVSIRAIPAVKPPPVRWPVARQTIQPAAQRETREAVDAGSTPT